MKLSGSKYLIVEWAIDIWSKSISWVWLKRKPNGYFVPSGKMYIPEGCDKEIEEELLWYYSSFIVDEVKFPSKICLIRNRNSRNYQRYFPPDQIQILSGRPPPRLKWKNQKKFSENLPTLLLQGPNRLQLLDDGGEGVGYDSDLENEDKLTVRCW